MSSSSHIATFEVMAMSVKIMVSWCNTMFQRNLCVILRNIRSQKMATLVLITMRNINLHSTSCFESISFLFSGLQSLLYCESNTGNGFLGITDGGQQSVDDNQWSYTSYYIHNQSSSLHKCGARPFVCTCTRQNSAGRYGLYQHLWTSC